MRRRDVAQLLAFGVVVAAIFAGLLRASGQEPLRASGRQVQAIVPTAVSLSPGSEVRVHGVKVGRVAEVGRRGDDAVLLLALRAGAPPVFRDATVDVRLRTVVGESFVALDPGSPARPELPDGGTLGPAQAIPNTQLDEVLSVFSPRVRAALRRDIATFGAALTDRGRALNGTLQGAASASESGDPVVATLARRRAQVTTITRSLGRLGAEIGTRGDDIATLARRTAPALSAFAAQRTAVLALLGELPGTLRAVDASTGRLQRFGTRATPVLRDLRLSVDRLRPALDRLRPTAVQTTRALDALDRFAPKGTKLFRRLAPFSRATSRTVPQLEKVLAQLNPVVRYLSPYTREVGGFFGSLGSMTDVADSLGHLGRMSAIVSVSTLATLTPEVISAYEGLQRLGGIDRSVGPHGFNFYPAPGEMADPQPFRGRYTRLQPDPIPSGSSPRDSGRRRG